MCDCTVCCVVTFCYTAATKYVLPEVDLLKESDGDVSMYAAISFIYKRLGSRAVFDRSPAFAYAAGWFILVYVTRY